jgi:hypothetical protein
MEPLATTLDDAVFHYTQLARIGLVALYRQTHKASGVDRFEVIRIQRRQAHTWPSGQTTPAHEGYPGSQSWGRHGWTYGSLAVAQGAFTQQVEEHQHAPSS